MFAEIVHEVNGNINALDALGIPLPPERDVRQQSGDDTKDIFSVNIPERSFKDETNCSEDHDMCGTGFYTGVTEFEESCHDYISSSTGTVPKRVKARHTAAEKNL